MGHHDNLEYLKGLQACKALTTSSSQEWPTGAHENQQVTKSTETGS